MTIHQPIPVGVSSRARSFLNANTESPVVYCSVARNGAVYRLANGQTFSLSRADCKHAGHPHWAHHDEYYFAPVSRRANREYEAQVLKAVRDEALLPSPLA